MPTITLEYDGRNSAIKHLIAELLALGAKVTPNGTPGTDPKQEIKDSLTTAFSELHAGKAKKDAHNLFA